MPKMTPENERLNLLTESLAETEALLAERPEIVDIKSGDARVTAIEYHKTLGDATVRLSDAIQKVRSSDATFYAGASMPHSQLTEKAQQVRFGKRSKELFVTLHSSSMDSRRQNLGALARFLSERARYLSVKSDEK